MKYWLLSLVLAASAVAAPSNILNVSYDVTREFYQDYNTLFARAYQAVDELERAIRRRPHVD